METFVTRDLAAATYLAYSGIKFASNYDKESKSWIFQEPDKCEALDLELRNGEAKVEIIKYESMRRSLLGMVKDVKRDVIITRADSNRIK